MPFPRSSGKPINEELDSIFSVLVVGSWIRQMQTFKQFSKSYLLSARKIHDDVSGLISALLNRSCPSAVAWLVVSVVVYTINGCIRWRPAHILKKVFVAVEPTIAYLYSARAIVQILWVCLAVAATLHFEPNSVFLCAAMSFAVCSLAGTSRLPLKTSTALDRSEIKLGSTGNLSCAAIALTEPHCASMMIGIIKAGHNQSPKAPASQLKLSHLGSMP